MPAVSANFGWGIIGAGGVARRRMLPVAAGHPEIEIVAVLVRDQQRATEIATEFGVPAAYARLADCLNDPDVHAVYVATPPDTHRGIVELAAHAGCHVLVEKPMALSIADAEAMVEATERAGVRLAVCFPLRHEAAIRRLRELLASGAIGRLTYLRAQLAKTYELAPEAWRADFRRGGGGVIMDLGSHLLDLAVWLGGPVDRLTAVSPRGLDGVEQSALLTGAFATGALLGIEVSFRVFGSHFAIEAYGETGLLRLGTDYLVIEDCGGRQRLPTPTGDDCYLAELLDFQRAVLAREPAVTSGQDGVTNCRLLGTAYASLNAEAS